MIKRLIRHELDFKLTYEHVQDNLNQTNALSIGTLNFLDLRKGHFFTLLPEGANLAQLYEFTAYGILPQYPEQGYYVDGRKSTYSRIPDIELEISHIMYKEVLLRNQLSFIFDDDAHLKDVIGYDLFDNYGYHFQDEIYYVINKEIASQKLIKKCLKDSNVLWHSLCLFTAADFSHVEKELTLTNIKEICQKTELFMVWAYDSEGYVFWEKEGCHFFKSCDNK